MTSLAGKVAIVTGASCGIGADTAKALVAAGMKVVGLARRKERMEELIKELEGKPGKLYAVKADVTEEKDTLGAFRWTTKNVGPVHVLINNAGVLHGTNLIDGDTQKWKATLDTNVLGLAIASREAIKIMMENKINGHIVNVNSVTGHRIVNYPGLNIYPATKHAVTALTETLRLDLIRMESKIKITSVSPGAVATEIFQTSGKMSAEAYAAFEKEGNMLQNEDVTNAILYVLRTPPNVQVTELTLMATGGDWTLNCK